MQAVRHRRDVTAAFHVRVRDITKTVAKFNDTGTATDRQSPGQQRVTSRWQDAFAVLRSRRNGFCRRQQLIVSCKHDNFSETACISARGVDSYSTKNKVTHLNRSMTNRYRECDTRRGGHTHD